MGTKLCLIQTPFPEYGVWCEETIGYKRSIVHTSNYCHMGINLTNGYAGRYENSNLRNGYSINNFRDIKMTWNLWCSVNMIRIKSLEPNTNVVYIQRELLLTQLWMTGSVICLILHGLHAYITD